jgi:hypothetical protein
MSLLAVSLVIRERMSYICFETMRQGEHFPGPLHAEFHKELGHMTMQLVSFITDHTGAHHGTAFFEALVIHWDIQMLHCEAASRGTPIGQLELVAANHAAPTSRSVAQSVPMGTSTRQCFNVTGESKDLVALLVAVPMEANTRLLTRWWGYWQRSHVVDHEGLPEAMTAG